MTTYVIRDSDGERGPYTAEQIRSMWKAGAITAEAVFQQKGRTEWWSLADVIDEQELRPSVIPRIFRVLFICVAVVPIVYVAGSYHIVTGGGVGITVVQRPDFPRCS